MTEAEFERFAATMKEQHREYDRRLTAMEKRQKDIKDLIQSVATIAQKQSDMDTDLKEIKSDVKNITMKPAKRWDSIIEKAILAAVGALIAYVAVQLGLQ